MRKLLIAATAVGLMAIAAPAFAGVGGTSEDSNNNVSCGVGTVANPATSVQVNTSGDQNGGAVVLCNDDTPDGPSPIQGRVIASGSTSGGGYVTADGDKDNDPAAQGWVRVNVGTSPSVKCGGPADSGTSTNSETNNGTQAACG